MGKKSFSIVLSILLVTFVLAMLLRFYQTESTVSVDFSNFPEEVGDWKAEINDVPAFVLDLLKPKEIYSANFTNSDGVRVEVLFDFFITEGSFGGPHSPRNCLPGSGWVLKDSEPQVIFINERSFSIGRIQIQQDQNKQVMDFWYVTNYGETSNDYIFKIYSMLSSLMFEPREVAFIRFIVEDQEESIKALDDLEKVLVPIIYEHLPFQ